MILTADWHIRKTVPRARIDDYFSAQETKLRFILKLAHESPPLLVAGDFFDQARPGPFLERWVIELLKEHNVKPIVVPGQHDLPGHSLEQIQDSGLGVLAAAGVIHLLDAFTHPLIIPSGPEIIWGCSYGQNPHPSMKDNQRFNILLWHHMVIDKPLWPGQEADKAHFILRKYMNFQMIVTGDNHQTFFMSPSSALDGKDRLLLNPGSMMRMTTAQIGHHPCVFKWEMGKLEQIFLPIEQDVLDLTQLEQEKQKDGRITAFIKSLDTQFESGLSYEKNIDEFLRTNNVSESVKKIVWECLE